MQRLHEKKIRVNKIYPIKQKQIIFPKHPHWLHHIDHPSIENQLNKYDTVI